MVDCEASTVFIKHLVDRFHLKDISDEYFERAMYDIPMTDKEICQDISWPKSCFNNETVTGIAGFGGYSTVYKLCSRDTCNHVAKVMRLPKSSKGTFQLREAQIQQYLGDQGIAPKVVFYTLCKVFPKWNYFVIIMDRYDGNLFELTDVKPKSQIKKWLAGSILPKIKKMHDLGVIHNDLGASNILYSKSNGKYKFVIADFGLSRRVMQVSPVERKRDLEKLQFIL